MCKSLRLLLLLLCTIPQLGIVTGQQTKGTANPSQTMEGPVVDYQQPPSSAEALLTPAQRSKRELKDKRYSGHQAKPIDDSPDQPIPSTLHWWQHLTALPAAKSNVVLLGTIVSSKAYFSSDRTAIYSEFTIQVEEVFKNQSSLPIGKGSSVVADRFGGIVRFPDGRTKVYRWNHEGWPASGQKYLLFLKNNEAGDFDIVTGYELRNGIVIPIDGADGKGGYIGPFQAYAGASEETLRKGLANALRDSGGASQ